MLVLCCIAAWAQPRLKRPEFYLGVHGGVSAGTVFFKPSVEGMTPITNAAVLGGNGGLVFRYAGHKYCHFQAELNYLHRGWATYTETAGHNYNNLHYVEIPILMHLNFGSEVCKWFLNLGPQIGYCVKDETNTIDHRFDWGLAGGTGFYIQTKKAGLYQLEIRADFSFGGIYGTTVIDKYSLASPFDLSVNLGWMIPVRPQIVDNKNLKKYENQL